MQTSLSIDSVSSVFVFLLKTTFFLNNFFHSQLHTDIFDLVSGIQKEAIKEEKLEKEKRRELKERKRLKERQKERVREKEVVREKEKEDEEVLCRTRLNDFEFHSSITVQIHHNHFTYNTCVKLFN